MQVFKCLVAIFALFVSLQFTACAADGGTASGARVYVTSGTDKRVAQQKDVGWQSEGSADGKTITIDSGKKFQNILGFGAAFTDAACFMINEVPEADRTKLLKELMSPEQLGLNVCRTCIGASDYATHLYSYDEGEPDPEMKRFSIAHDQKYILPILREALKINPDLYLFSSPWSPPGWMKANKSMLGGNMQRQYMPAYAQYFLKFVQAYKADGVPIKAVTVQNEVDTDQDGRMPACAWPQEYEVDFVRNDLGPLFQKEGLATEIWIIDHNYNLWGRALGSLDTENLLKFVKGIAWHGYAGDASRISTVHDAYPSVDMYWTEGGPDVTDPNYAKDWSKWSNTFTGNLRNWCRSITAWNMALDETGKPNIGPFPCGGLVTIDSKTKKWSCSGQYWAIAHYSKFVKRGAKRIESTGTVPNVSHVAFENADGKHVAVITNSGEATSVSLKNGEKNLNLALDADSVTTLVW